MTKKVLVVANQTVGGRSLLEAVEKRKGAEQQIMQYTFIGTASTLEPALQSFVEATGIHELMVAAHIYDPGAKKRSFEIIGGMFRSSL